MTEKTLPVTDGLTNQLFGKVITPDRPAPTLDYDSLKYGAIVRHEGIKVIEYKKDNRDRKTKLHMFSTRGGIGGWFSTFGTANLDSQLRKTRAGSVLYLRYVGKEAIEGTEQEQHIWEVRETAATATQIAQLRDRPEWRDRELALDGAIAQASKAELERRENRRSEAGGDEPPPPSDDDAPGY